MMDAATRSARLEALRRRMHEAGLELVALAPSDNFRYVAGFSPFADERACMLLVTFGSALVLIPSLNAEQAAAEAPELELLTWDDDAGPTGSLRDALSRVGGASAVRIAADPEMRADHLLLLQATLPDATFVPASVAIRPLREVKSDEELRLLSLAARAADDAVRAALTACRGGVTELKVAEAATAAFNAAGCEDVLFTIVAGGPNGAYPHHKTGGRALEEGDGIVIDIGARLNGYVSDITRMAFVGEPSERYLEVHTLVEAAVKAGLAATCTGTTGHEVDAAVRGVVEGGGFGKYFVHRTGHGLGLSVHEPPWIMRGEHAELRPGMVHSIEPGIYLPGELGIRLEEIVRVTSAGCKRLSALPREVHIVEV